jgi:hypothetical protein
MLASLQILVSIRILTEVIFEAVLVEADVFLASRLHLHKELQYGLFCSRLSFFLLLPFLLSDFFRAWLLHIWLD